MVRLRKASERGRTSLPWLDGRHSFSFGDYQDPGQMGFRTLRVLNEDRIAPGGGFPTHPHRDMEILTYVLEGALEHRDSLGNGSVIRPGEVQRMSAGTGVTHSEANASKTERVHLLQVWTLPEEKGRTPSYAQKPVPPGKGLRLLDEPRSDTKVYAAVLEAGETLEHPLGPGRHAWVQAARGRVRVNGTSLVAGDGAALSGEGSLLLEASERSELLVFDLA